MTRARLTELLQEAKSDDPAVREAARLQIKRAIAAANRKAKDDAYESVGMKKVKGNLGGTYYE